MRNLKVALAILVISISSMISVSAINENPVNKNVNSELRLEIAKLLGHHNYKLNEVTIQADVSVMLNNKNELVVLSVDSDHKNIESFVTTKLNYKKITIKGLAKGSIYTIPLKII